MNLSVSSIRRGFACFSVRLTIALVASVATGIAVQAQQKPKRNTEVLVTLDACSPDSGTLNLYIWETQPPGNSIINTTWDGSPSGSPAHSGARHIKILPYHDYSVTLTRLEQPMTWGDIKLSAPPGYAVFINGVSRESFHVVPSELVNGIFAFSVREVGDGGLLPAGLALPPDVADFVWTMSTGTYANGLPLTPVQLRGQSLSAAMLSPKALTFLTPYSPEVGVVNHSDGGLLEIETFQAIYHFKRGSPASGYTIEVYSPYAIRTGSGDGPFTYDEQPFREFRVSNPDGAAWNNRLKIEKLEREGASTTSETWTVTQNGSNWTVVETSSLRTITRASTTAAGVRTETVTVADNNATVATKLARKYKTFDWGQEELTEETLNPDASNGIALTTRYYYHETVGTGGYSRLKAVEAPDGSWVRYDYDDGLAGLGNLTGVNKPWRGAPADYSAATSTDSFTTILSYGTGKTSYTDLPSGSVSKIVGVQSSQTDVVTTYPATAAANGEPLRKDTVKVYSRSGASNSLTTIVQTYDPQSASAAFRGRKYSEVRPDGTQTSHLFFQAYFQNLGDNNGTKLFTAPSNNNTWGEYRFHGFSTQVADSVAVNGSFGGYIEPIYMVPKRSTVELFVYNDKGRPQYMINYVLSGVNGEAPEFEFLSMTEIIDDGGIPAVQQSLDGVREQRIYSGEMLTSVVANDGSTMEFTRDALGRDTMLRKIGMTGSDPYAAQGDLYVHKTFDASNRVLTEKLSSSATATDSGIQSSYNYYLSGRLKSQTDSSGLTTSFAYSNGGRTITITSPLGTSTTDSHPLGSYTYGTTVVPQFSRIVRNSDGTLTTETYTLTGADKTAIDTALAKASLATADGDLSTALGAVKRWSRVTTDWAGRTLKEERPAPQGTTPTSLTKQYYYNGVGQLTKVTETNLADTLIAYNAWQQAYRTGLDLSSPNESAGSFTPNGVLDESSKDRFTETETQFAKDSNNAWWSVTTSKSYNAENQSTASTTTVKQRLNKYSNHGASAAGDYVQKETKAIDLFGNVTTMKVAVQRGSGASNTNVRLVTETIDLPNSTSDEVTVARNGLLQSRQSKEGLVYKNYYDEFGRPTKTTDPRTDASSTARIGYFDGNAAVGNQHKVAWRDDSAGNRTNYTYSSATGLLFSETNPMSKAVYHDYNTRGQERRTWGAATQPVEYGFNDYGERTTMRTWRDAPSGVDFTTSTWGTTTYPSTSGEVTTWSYDAATGLLLSKTVPAAEPNSSDPIRNTAQKVEYTYNARGQLKTRDWARAFGAGKLTTTYYYFGEGANEPKTGEIRLIDYEDGTPDVTLTYNRQALPKTIADATGSRSFEYCDCGKPLYELFDATFFGGRKLTYNFDAVTSGALGRTYGYSVSVGTTTVEQDISYGFDAYGRFNKLTNLGSGIVFDYAYTANSNLLGSITNTSTGWTQTRAYETSRDVLDVIETKFGVSTKAKFDYTVDTLGRRSDVAKTGEMFSRYGATGVDTHWDYNDRSEITGETMKEGGTVNDLKGRSLGFDFDLMGNRKTATIDGRTLTYARNPLNQYDSVAGRTFADVTGLAPAAATVTVNGTAVPAANRKGDYFFQPVTPGSQPSWQDATVVAGSDSSTRKIFLPAATEPLKYDADGNLTSDGRWNYIYDAENRLISVETKPDLRSSPAGPMPQADAKRLEFIYDYMGRRVEKLVRANFNGTTYTNVTRTRYIYEGWNLATEYSATVSPTTTLTLAKVYTWGLDWSGSRQGAGGVGGLQFVTDHLAGASYFPVYDGNGNVMGLVNTAGAFTAIYEYDAFGQTIRAEGSAANSNAFRFSTKFTDLETGLVYYGLRYYSPSLGRFINRDPIEERGGLNLYAFCTNNGINGWDYLGQDTEYHWGAAAWRNGIPTPAGDRVLTNWRIEPTSPGVSVGAFGGRVGVEVSRTQPVPDHRVETGMGGITVYSYGQSTDATYDIYGQYGVGRTNILSLKVNEYNGWSQQYGGMPTADDTLISTEWFTKAGLSGENANFSTSVTGDFSPDGKVEFTLLEYSLPMIPGVAIKADYVPKVNTFRAGGAGSAGNIHTPAIGGGGVGRAVGNSQASSYTPLSSDPVVKLAPFEVKGKGVARKETNGSGAGRGAGASRPTVPGATVLTDPEEIAAALGAVAGGGGDTDAALQVMRELMKKKRL